MPSAVCRMSRSTAAATFGRCICQGLAHVQAACSAGAYLRTRYIALASIVSVTLGVATMIVVNSVMAGFTHEMQNRIHGILSDMVFESHSLDGFHDRRVAHAARFAEIAGDYDRGHDSHGHRAGHAQFQVGGQWITRQVQFIGIDERTHSQVSDFGKYLQHPANREQLSFTLRDDGYDTHDHQAGADAPQRPEMGIAGWQWRADAASSRSGNAAKMMQLRPANAGRTARPLRPPSIGSRRRSCQAAPDDRCHRPGARSGESAADSGDGRADRDSGLPADASRRTTGGGDRPRWPNRCVRERRRHSARTPEVVSIRSRAAHRRGAGHRPGQLSRHEGTDRFLLCRATT